MDTSEVLTDAFGRLEGLVRHATAGLDPEALAFRPDPEANSIAWLLWHLTRVEDDHVSELAGREQAWVAEGWHEAFGMPPDPHDTGYGHTSEQVGRLRPPSAEPLLGYHAAVSARTLEYVAQVDAEELDRVVDRSFDPPVTVGVRLVSVLGDTLQHVGQAAYLRGLVGRR